LHRICLLLTQSGRRHANFAVTHNAAPTCECARVQILCLGKPMRRREFIRLFGSAVVAWPRAARAQQSAMPMIGFLRSTSLTDAAHLVTGFRNGLEEAGFVEGQNVVVEYRSANDQLERLPVLVAELIGRQAAVIVGNTNAALAAKAATTTVPIVFAIGSDPVKDGLVASLNRPGGNVTGVTFLTGELGTKRLDLVRELVPTASTIAMLVDPNSPEGAAERQTVQAAAQAISRQLIVLDANSERELDTAFATFANAVPVRCSAAPVRS
jgi:putative tryptophan/tyrosine transport system substrate-binding protein